MGTVSDIFRAQLDQAGAGGGDMESRVAKLESDVEYIKRDISEIKADLKDFKKDTSVNFKSLRSDNNELKVSFAKLDSSNKLIMALLTAVVAGMVKIIFFTTP